MLLHKSRMDKLNGYTSYVDRWISYWNTGVGIKEKEE